MKDKYTYSLDIRRYNIHETFGCVEDLRSAVRQYFTSKEKYIVDTLTAFPENKWETIGEGDAAYERQVNSWRDFEVRATR